MQHIIEVRDNLQKAIKAIPTVKRVFERYVGSCKEPNGTNFLICYFLNNCVLYDGNPALLLLCCEDGLSSELCVISYKRRA